MKRLRWESADRGKPLPKHPYRDSAILDAAMAALVVIIAVATGAESRTRRHRGCRLRCRDALELAHLAEPPDGDKRATSAALNGSGRRKTASRSADEQQR